MYHMSCRPVMQVPLTTISQTELRNWFVLKILSNVFFFFCSQLSQPRCSMTLWSVIKRIWNLRYFSLTKMRCSISSKKHNSSYLNVVNEWNQYHKVAELDVVYPTCKFKFHDYIHQITTCNRISCRQLLTLAYKILTIILLVLKRQHSIWQILICWW